MTAGQRIRAALRRKAWTASRLAGELGIRPQNLALVLHDQRPGRVHLPRIAELLDVPVEWITTGHPPQPWDDSERNVDEPSVAAVAAPDRHGAASEADERPDSNEST